MPRMSPQDLETLAQRRASAQMGWFLHAAVYLLVNGALFAAHALGWRQAPWQLGPALGWGLGLALHGVSVFVLRQGARWREDLVARERERLRREQERP
ncbi:MULTISPECIES: 2TM domain-containing protein [Ramlibacter]|uniref:2TM domain-containing protein n=1 Tax=Ramlibacter aquaticus TaxID=2780094 RepID=A0ABR9S9F2_9BURK|nr:MULTISPECIES: 2TM domain-containing protein [Ramlibacter]MBE7938979.1 2TM domain-containing protein [Ramlibacter aquaticus]